MKSIDVLFVTSSKTGLVQFSIYPFLGVGYLSELLKRKNISSRLFDADINTNIVDLLQEIDEFKPMVVAYSIMSISLPFFYKITKTIKARYPDQVIVAGGPHVTNDPNVIFEMDIDYGFLGYSEKSFPEFIERLKNGDNRFEDISGIVIKSTGRIDSPAFFDISDFDIHPNYELYDIAKYQNISYGRSWFTVITSRGCAYNCKFCKDPGKNRYKEYPIESVKRQIKYLVENYNLEWLTFVDDSFTYNRERVIYLCNWFLEEDFKFKWTCMTRAELLDKELIQIMKKSGLDYVIIGVEAGDEDVRKSINKYIPNDLYLKAIRELRNNKIRVLCSYIYGNIDEKPKEMFKTLRFALKLNSDYAQFYNMIALPSTPVFHLAVKEDKLSVDVWYKYMRQENGLPYYFSKKTSKFFTTFIKRISFFIYYSKPSRFFDLLLRFIKFYFYIQGIKRTNKNKL